MKKSRILSNVWLFCLFLVFSAFFYCFDTYAAVDQSLDLSDQVALLSVVPEDLELEYKYFSYFNCTDSNKIDLSAYLPGSDSEGWYKVSFDVDITFESYASVSPAWRDVKVLFKTSDSVFACSVSSSGYKDTLTVMLHPVVYVSLDAPQLTVDYSGFLVWVSSLVEDDKSIEISCKFSKPSGYSVTKLSSASDNQYQTGYDSGYNIGYSDGQTAGYDQGYSAGFADGSSTAGNYQAGYQAGYDDGIASVDTDQYYQAGYQAGYAYAYDVGYDAGEESGFKKGYQAALDRVAQWGADTSDYPKQVYTTSSLSHTFSFSVPPRQVDAGNNPPLYDFYDSYKVNAAFDIDYTHVYKFSVSLPSAKFSKVGSATYEELRFKLLVGSSEYILVSGSTPLNFYLSSDLMASAWALQCSFLGVFNDSNISSSLSVKLSSFVVEIYDCGPEGNLQNQLAHQTDQITSGYDSSAGSTMNDQFSSSVSDYQQAEDSLFDAATSGMNDFEFINFTSYPALVTAMTFVTSTMSSIYQIFGGESGPIGIVLAVLFSVMLVSMVIGLYRFYQSKK